jgi:phenylalanyl-tRNA synthetase beta chain
MKISLNWIFDHIKGELLSLNITQLVDAFIKTTAEVESWKKVALNVDELTLVEVITIKNSDVTVYSAEHKMHYVLPFRADVFVGVLCMVANGESAQKWATSIMLGGVKDILLPVIDVAEHLRAGAWKSTIELQDYIVEVDNKSINSRPDLWGHRGLAREIAAILDLPLRPLNELIKKKDIISHELTAKADENSPFSLAIQDSLLCSRFAALYVPSIDVKASQLGMIVRLSRLDSRAINFLVDATNYVMLDLGQPMHAFDADALSSKKITIGRALPKEKIVLLDGETLELTSEDVVVADGGKVVSLAGIMGGAATGINLQTKSVLLESAHFDPVVIRRTSARHKKRTESSVRFEKNLDPHQNIDALKRFIFLLDVAKIKYQANDHILSLGVTPQSKIITVQHAFIEARLGIIIKPERIVEILNKIDFEVVQAVENDVSVYTITVPSFRATKDVKIPEDIVEEVGRYIGYDTIPRVMPSLQLHPSDLHKTYITRAIKSFFSYGLMMHELYGYSFFDESVLKELAWQPTDFVAVKNPVSENYTRLVTTLQPHLLKAIGENSTHYSQLRFYEWGRIWRMQGEEIIEQKVVSGIFFEHSLSSVGLIDFYAGKALLMRMFEKLHMNVTWVPSFDELRTSGGVGFSWCSSHQTAIIMHENKRIGAAGMVDASVLGLFSLAGGSAFIFELDADYFLGYKRPLKRFESLSKYPSVRRDISVLISVTATTDALIHMIKTVDDRIQTVTLIDFFSKSEWKDRKAMTFHVEMCDKEKTFVADEVEEIWNRVIAQLQEQGAVIR